MLPRHGPDESPCVQPGETQEPVRSLTWLGERTFCVALNHALLFTDCMSSLWSKKLISHEVIANSILIIINIMLRIIASAALYNHFKLFVVVEVEVFIMWFTRFFLLI